MWSVVRYSLYFSILTLKLVSLPPGITDETSSVEAEVSSLFSRIMCLSTVIKCFCTAYRLS